VTAAPLYRGEDGVTSLTWKFQPARAAATTDGADR
jgi:hypothetical protein